MDIPMIGDQSVGKYIMNSLNLYGGLGVVFPGCFDISTNQTLASTMVNSLNLQGQDADGVQNQEPELQGIVNEQNLEHYQGVGFHGRLDNNTAVLTNIAQAENINSAIGNKHLDGQCPEEDFISEADSNTPLINNVESPTGS